jgi:vitamin B12 transporter
MNTRSPVLARGRLFIIPLAAACAVAPFTLHAQTDVTSLSPVVVSATRTPQDLQYASSSVTSFSLPALADMQVTDLRTALAGTPGVTVVNSGAVGSQSSVFVRGANSDQTLFVVDGVRLNTTNISYANFLGGADLTGLARLEVLRGPQSALYGSSAMGGVILLETAHGGGTSTDVAAASVGSFGSLDASVAVAGVANTFDYSVSLTREQTDNDRPDNRYKDWSYSTRLEGQISPWLLVGATLRGLKGQYEEPGPITYFSPGNVQAVTDLATTYAEVRASEQFRSRLTGGWYQDEYTFNDGVPYDFYYARNTREILDWQNTWEASSWSELVAGANAEWSHYQAGGMTTDRSLAGFFSSMLHPTRDLELTAGLRYDHFDTAGEATTWHAGAAYRLGKDTKLRATYGTGFNAPTPADRYGLPPYLLPNPGIFPEKSRGWDVGLDQTVLDGRITLGVTYFENRFRDLLEYQVKNPVTYAGSEVNVDRATTSGIELQTNAKLISVFTMSAGYTYLHAVDDVTETRLIRRPRHALDASLDAQVTRKWLIGAAAHLVADRVDGAFTSSPLGGYTTFRLYTSYAIRPDLILKMRVENLLDRKYQEIAGYPALPRGAYGSVEWRF